MKSLRRAQHCAAPPRADEGPYMCAICGMVTADRAQPIDRATLARMRDQMEHRGPDDAGLYVGEGVGLGSRRLAILDLSPRGHMPMSTADQRFWIAYNGEVYNYRELRTSLESRGHQFVSDSDTEVVLKLFAAEGAGMLGKLNGMFAFAVWDAVERRLFIARDRLGIKPLFYAVDRGRLYFASEEKALFAAGVPPRFDHRVWSELLCFRYVAGERTPFEGIRRLLPGHWLMWQDGRIDIRRWWSLAERTRERREPVPDDPDQWYRETFDDAIRLRRISDVPVGVLLSGGLDSSTVAASLALQAGRDVASFTVGFPPPHYDERPLARQVVERYALEPHEIEVAPERLLSKLRSASRFNDEPLAHASDTHLLAISEHAKPRVTVLLSGEGADETLGGYVRYKPLRHPLLLRGAQSMATTLGRIAWRSPRWRKLRKWLALGSLRQVVIYNACDVFPTDLARFGLIAGPEPLEFRERVVAEAEGVYPGDLARQAMYSDQHTFLCSVLDRNDRMTMGASIECRVPFLDYRLVEGVAALPSDVLLRGRESKPLLRHSLGDRLPAEILTHRKWGFGVPWTAYLREVPQLRDLVQGLPRHELLADAPFDRQVIAGHVREFLAGDNEPGAFLLGLVMTTQSWESVGANGATAAVI